MWRPPHETNITNTAKDLTRNVATDLSLIILLRLCLQIDIDDTAASVVRSSSNIQLQFASHLEYVMYIFGGTTASGKENDA